MRLVSRKRHTVELLGEVIAFEEDEHIVTEYSHKYSVEGFLALAAGTGWICNSSWIDQNGWFSVHFLTVPNE
jgi:uncharacterized SAM-dependent methyltransferase